MMQQASVLDGQTMVAKEVARALRLSVQGVYEFAKREPERLGVLRIGRSVRFRRSAIERLLNGGG